jgi:hypothetical protein
MTPSEGFDSKSLIEMPLTRRSLMVSAALFPLMSAFPSVATGSSSPTVNMIIGRPTNESIAISLISSKDLDLSFQYGLRTGRLTKKTSTKTVSAGEPVVFEIGALPPDTRIFYRPRFLVKGEKLFRLGKEHSFVTSRASGQTFSFSVQGDTHPEREGKMFDPELYDVTLENIQSQRNDFHILLGDDFSIDPLISKGQATKSNVEKIYASHRQKLAVVGASTPLFLVNGNHEQAARYLLDGTETNPAVLAGKARIKYFPLPAPNTFYSGNKTEIPGIGLPRDYYAWHWGDALFITLDPYWHSASAVDNVAGTTTETTQSGNEKKSSKAGTKAAGSGKNKDLWTIGIGDEQYAWFKQVLESSTAKYKFVFAHHVMGTGRGGVELSRDYEWGGNDPKGTTTFEKERPNWELPIHDLMVKNHVSIFFQGHDHIFVTQERDGVIYQSMPNPADDTFSYFNESAYKEGVKAPNSGHVRVTVTPDLAKVEYFLAGRKIDRDRENLQIAHSYTIAPRASD